jgi:subtilisin family serine protease
MSKRKRTKSRIKLTKKAAKKLDPSLVRLLSMTDEETFRKFENEEAKIKTKIKEIESIAEVLSPTATIEDRKAVQKVQELYKTSLYRPPIFDAIIIDKVKIEPIKVRAIIHFTGNRDDLTAMGLKVIAQAQDIFTIIGTKQQLANLAQQPATLRISLPVMYVIAMKDAAIQADIYPVHKPNYHPGVTDGYQGDDVIVGIIDKPIDVAHNAFRHPTGSHNTRILYYWVQEDMLNNPNPPGLTPEEYMNQQKNNNLDAPDFSNLDKGRIYTESAINTALNNQQTKGTYGNDPDQICCSPIVNNPTDHGTEVAGIAVGNGYESNWSQGTLIGAAPRADIVYVTCVTTDFNVMNALKFILAIAQKENKPVVVNMSFDGHVGPHVGTDPIDKFIDNTLNPFPEKMKAIVGITQNWNAKDGFRKGTINGTTTETFTVTPKSDGITTILDVWYTGPELKFQISIAGDPSGFAAGTGYHDFILSGYNVEVDCVEETEINMRQLKITFNNVKKTDPIQIELENPSNPDVIYYAWSRKDGRNLIINGSTKNEMTLSSRACCKSQITVGACVKIPSGDFGVSYPDPTKAESIAQYSGVGPTLDGRIKPEIVAVGGSIDMNTIANFNPVLTTKSNDVGTYSAVEGTSYAAPLVSGAVALLFQAAKFYNYELNHDTVKALLIQYAKRDPSDDLNNYGNGRLRLRPAIDHIKGPTPVDLWIRTADDDYGLEPFLGGCICASPDIKVYKEGTNEEIYELSWDKTYDVKVVVHNLGTDLAKDATISLKYTKPRATPVDWEPCANSITDDVPALDKIEVNFKWTPNAEKINADPGMTHFCLLAETYHDKDSYEYATDDPWRNNIGGKNNIALRNVCIK